MLGSRADVESARGIFHIRGMKNLITAPLALALLALSLSGCAWYPYHGWHHHGGYHGHGDHGGYYH
jgi:hypothetical protein